MSEATVWHAVEGSNDSGYELRISDQPIASDLAFSAPSLPILMAGVSKVKMWRRYLSVVISKTNSDWCIDKNEPLSYFGSENVEHMKFILALPRVTLSSASLFQSLGSLFINCVVSRNSPAQPLFAHGMILPPQLRVISITVLDESFTNDSQTPPTFSVDYNLAPIRQMHTLTELSLLGNGRAGGVERNNRTVCIEISRDFFNGTPMTTSLYELTIESYRMELEPATIECLSDLSSLWYNTIDCSRTNTLLDSIGSWREMILIYAPQAIFFTLRPLSGASVSYRPKRRRDVHGV